MKKFKAHRVVHTSSLNTKPKFMGLNTQDMVLVSGVAFSLSLILRGQSIWMKYLTIGGVCVSILIVLYLKDRLLPKNGLYFLVRSYFVPKNKYFSARDLTKIED